MFLSISKFYFYALGALLFAASHASAEIRDWTLAFTGLDSDFSYGSTEEIFLEYKIGTGRSSFDVNVLTKGCIEPIVDTTVRISSSTTDAEDEVQDLKVSLSLDKPNLVGSQIWNNDSKSVELCVRVDSLSAKNLVIKRNERDIKFDFDYRVEFTTTDNVNLTQLIPEDETVAELISVINITLSDFSLISAEVAKMETEDDTDTVATVIEAFQAAVENLLQVAGIDAIVEVTGSEDTRTGDLDITVEITFTAYCYGSNVCVSEVKELFETFEFEFTQSVDNGSFENSVQEEAAADGVDLSSMSITEASVSKDVEVVQIIGLSQTTATVANYVEACTCYGANNFDCNTNLLGPDDYLNVCIKSANTEMEIDVLGNITITQDDTEFVIVKNGDLRDKTISSKTKVTQENGMHVASIIPPDFFSYDRNTNAQVAGVVYLKLANSRRRLAVEITANPEVTATGSTRALATPLGATETGFAINVLLAKNELEAIILVLEDGTNASSSIKVMMSGIIVASAIAAVAIMVVFFVKKSRGSGS